MLQVNYSVMWCIVTCSRQCLRPQVQSGLDIGCSLCRGRTSRCTHVDHPWSWPCVFMCWAGARNWSTVISSALTIYKCACRMWLIWYTPQFADALLIEQKIVRLTYTSSYIYGIRMRSLTGSQTPWIYQRGFRCSERCTDCYRLADTGGPCRAVETAGPPALRDSRGSSS